MGGLFRCVLFLAVIYNCSGYSVLTHEALIDSVWVTHLRPMLKSRFPTASEEDLRKAHAYVYGGSLFNDMGYAPLSSRFVSDLTHYVRPAAFVETMIEQSQTLNEYAFSLGVLAHFAGDTAGYPAINKITTWTYPKFAAKFPNGVAYEDARSQHLKTEFALDVVQVARKLYAPDEYHDFIGFEVEQAEIERVFPMVYGLKFESLFLSDELAIGTFRYGVGNLIPKLTRVAWDSKRSDIEKLSPSLTRGQFAYLMPRRLYEKEWGTKYKKPGISDRILSLLFRLIPTFGPFKAFGFRPVSQASEKLFLEAFDTTVLKYRGYLEDVQSKRLRLTEVNLDTGRAIKPGDYRLADQTYVELLHRLADRKFEEMPKAVGESLQKFLSDPSRLSAKSTRPETREELQQLRAKVPH